MNTISDEAFLQDLVQLTNQIKNKPEIYLGEVSLTKFYHFSNGFSEAYHHLDSEKKYFRVYPGFQEWVQNKYNISSTQSWCSILLFYSNNEKEGLELFFKEFKEFNDNKLEV